MHRSQNTNGTKYKTYIEKCDKIQVIRYKQHKIQMQQYTKLTNDQNKRVA